VAACEEVHSNPGWTPGVSHPSFPFLWEGQGQTMVNDILSSLKPKIYQGDRKNFNFDKYCLAHVAEHNRHTSLVEYDNAPLEESMKIHNLVFG
jgi:hypothetical protein